MEKREQRKKYGRNYLQSTEEHLLINEYCIYFGEIRSFRLFLQHNEILCCSMGLTFNVNQFQMEMDRIWIRNTYGFIHSHIKSGGSIISIGAQYKRTLHSLLEVSTKQRLQNEQSTWTYTILHTHLFMMQGLWSMFHDVYVQQNLFSFFSPFFALFCCLFSFIFIIVYSFVS